MSEFTPLALSTLDDDVSYLSPEQHFAEALTLHSPAIDVMTDFRLVSAFTVGLTASVNQAQTIMMRHRVRLLLVTDDHGAVRGLITSRDIDGERPQKLLRRSYLTPEELLVRDIMTLKGRLEVLELSAVQDAVVGDIVSTLRDCHRQHAMVIERMSEGEQAVRGLFSLSQIARLLGCEFDPAQGALTPEEFDDLMAQRQDSSARDEAEDDDDVGC